MALYRLVNTNTNEILKIQRMGHDAAKYFNQHTPENQEWRKGLDKETHRPVLSLVQIFRTLDVEGLTDNQLNTIKRWARHNRQQATILQEKIQRQEAKFSAVMKNLTDAERQSVGKFISIRAKESFEAGLRLGLAGRLLHDELEDSYTKE